TRFSRDWSSDVCSSDLVALVEDGPGGEERRHESVVVHANPLGHLLAGEIGPPLVDSQERRLAAHEATRERFEAELKPRFYGLHEIGRASCRERVEIAVV